MCVCVCVGGGGGGGGQVLEVNILKVVDAACVAQLQGGVL